MPPSAKDEVESHHRAQVQSLSSTSAGLQISGKDMTRTVVEIECIGLESGSPIFDDPFSSSLDLEQLGVARTKGELGAHVPMELVSPRTPEHVDRAIGPDAQRFGMRPSQRRLDFPVMDVAGTPDRTMAGKYATGDTPGRQRPLDIMCTPPNGCMSRSTSPTGQSLPPKPFRSRVASPVSGCALTRSNSAVEFSDGLDSSAHKRISADMMAEQQSRHVRTNSVDSYENGRRRSVGGDSNPFDRGRQPGESCNGGAHPIAPSGNFMESLVGLAQTLVGSNLLQDADSALAVSKIMMGMSELALSFSKQAAAANGTVAAAPEVVSPVKAAPPPETPPRVVMPSPNHGPLHVTPSYLGKSPPLHSFSPMPSFSQTPGLLAQALNSAPISPKNVAVSGGGSAPPRKARGFSLPCSPHLTPFGTPVGTPAATPGNSPRSAHDTPSGLAFKNLGGPPLHTLTEEQLEQRLKAAKAAADNARWKVKYVGKVRRMPLEYYTLKALTEQMTAGDCSKPQPMFDAAGALDHEGREVWRLWKEMAGMSRGDARKKYITVVEELDCSALRPGPTRSISMNNLAASQGGSLVGAVGVAAAAAVAAVATAQASGQRNGGVHLFERPS